MTIPFSKYVKAKRQTIFKFFTRRNFFYKLFYKFSPINIIVFLLYLFQLFPYPNAKTSVDIHQVYFVYKAYTYLPNLHREVKTNINSIVKIKFPL